jgi:hypothetical protein
MLLWSYLRCRAEAFAARVIAISCENCRQYWSASALMLGTERGVLLGGHGDAWPWRQWLR